MELATLLELLASFLHYTTFVVDNFALELPLLLCLWGLPQYRLVQPAPFCGSLGQLLCKGWHQVAVLGHRLLASAARFEIAWLLQLTGQQLMQLR